MASSLNPLKKTVECIISRFRAKQILGTNGRKNPRRRCLNDVFPWFIQEIHDRHGIFDTIVSQETKGLLNTGYAALFETAQTGRSYYGRLSKEGAQSGMFFEVGYQFR